MYNSSVASDKMKQRMPAVYAAVANSHFGAHARRETEHLQTSTELPRGKIHSEVKFNEKQKLKSFFNQFGLNQHNVITESLSVTGLPVCPRRGTMCGGGIKVNKSEEAFLLQQSTQ